MSALEIAAMLRGIARYAEIDPFPPSPQYIRPDAIRAAADDIERLSLRERKLAELVQCLIDNDPCEPISDAGHTILSLWRHEAGQIIRARGEQA